MKTATVRDLRYSFSRIARWLRAGESVEITYRRKRLARLIPAIRPTAEAPQPPDFASRLKRLFPDGSEGEPASDIILEGRGDR
jgi:antitoxin (DNA-binding transcriptional repressor) of toxin-antitoxin stability system